MYRKSLFERMSDVARREFKPMPQGGRRPERKVERTLGDQPVKQ